MNNIKMQNNNILILLFFSLYMVLPSYFAIEITESLPLLTASRMVLIICFLTVIIKQKGKLSIPKLTKIDVNIKIYFILIFIVNIIHITDSKSDSLNHIITIFIEQISILWIVMILINTRQKFEEAVEILMYTSGVVAIISIVGFIFNTNIFYVLKTVSRVMTQAGITDIGYRNGLLRIEAGFGHPVYYGMYCSVMIFLSIYIYNYKKRKLSAAVCILLNTIALLLTNSRGVMLAVVATFAISFFVNGWEERKKYLRIICISIFFVIIVCVCSFSIRKYMFNIIQSFFVYFGLSNNVLNNYGANTNYTTDRLMQFTGIHWTLKHSPFFGFGYGAQANGVIEYYNNGRWFKTSTFDVGFVELFCCYGIMGVVACIFLIKGLLSNIRYIKREAYWILFRNIFLVYFLCLFSVVNIDKIFWVLFGLLLAYSRIINRERKSGLYDDKKA